MKKVIMNGKVVKVGSQQIQWSEFKDMYRDGKLMVLGYCPDTNELLWDASPDWWFLIKYKKFNLYCVEDPNKRVAKTFKSLPVNARLPHSFFEIR